MVTSALPAVTAKAGDVREIASDAALGTSTGITAIEQQVLQTTTQPGDEVSTPPALNDGALLMAGQVHNSELSCGNALMPPPSAKELQLAKEVIDSTVQKLLEEISLKVALEEDDEVESGAPVLSPMSQEGILPAKGTGAPMGAPVQEVAGSELPAIDRDTRIPSPKPKVRRTGAKGKEHILAPPHDKLLRRSSRSSAGQDDHTLAKNAWQQRKNLSSQVQLLLPPFLIL